MHRIGCVAALCAVLSGGAAAQSSPNWSYGYVPTAGQWNAAFAAKQDVLGFTPLSISGGTLIGPLHFAPSSTSFASGNIPIGVAPTSPNQGDVWSTSSGVFIYFNGAAHPIYPTAAQGQCTMTAGACAVQSLGFTYPAAPLCVLTWTGTGTLAGALKVVSSTTTVTPSSSNGADTAQVNWACFGN
jgi:hypothetical protein